MLFELDMWLNFRYLVWIDLDMWFIELEFRYVLIWIGYVELEMCYFELDRLKNDKPWYTDCFFFF